MMNVLLAIGPGVLVAVVAGVIPFLPALSPAGRRLRRLERLVALAKDVDEPVTKRSLQHLVYVLGLRVTEDVLGAERPARRFVMRTSWLVAALAFGVVIVYAFNKETQIGNIAQTSLAVLGMLQAVLIGLVIVLSVTPLEVSKALNHSRKSMRALEREVAKIRVRDEIYQRNRTAEVEKLLGVTSDETVGTND